MKSLVRPSFWRAYDQLAENAKRDARKAYALFAEDPNHPSPAPGGLRLTLRAGVSPTTFYYDAITATKAARAQSVRTNPQSKRRFRGKGSIDPHLGQYPLIAERDLHRWQRAMANG